MRAILIFSFSLLLIGIFSFTYEVNAQEAKQQNNKQQRTDSQKSYVQPRNRNAKKTTGSPEALKKSDANSKRALGSETKKLPNR